MRISHNDVQIAPELEPLNLSEKPDGPGGAAMVSAGFGIFVLGLLTTWAHAWSGLSDFLADFSLGRGVGPLAGKSTVAVLAWLISWGLLHVRWRAHDVNLTRTFTIGVALGLLGALGTFPTFFEAF